MSIFFWIAWGLISIWAIKTFYFSFSKEKFEGLRKTCIGLTISVLVLSFLPWVPPELGGTSGVGLAFDGYFLAILLVVLLLIALVLFFQKEHLFLKIAAILTVLSTLVLFVFMLFLRPGTFTLSLYDIAPIVAVLILLVADIAVLLLWQQMQLQSKGEVVPDKKKKINAVIISSIPVILGVLLFTSGGLTTSLPWDRAGEGDIVLDPPPYTKKAEALSPNEPGLVCVNNNFSLRTTSSYSVLFESKSSVMLVTKGVLVVIANYGSDPALELETYLQEAGYTYTTEGGLYAYTLHGDSEGAKSSRPNVLSTSKDTFVITVFYPPSKTQEQAEIVVQEVRDTIEGGC